jgi:hypothetical protein
MDFWPGKTFRRSFCSFRSRHRSATDCGVRHGEKRRRHEFDLRAAHVQGRGERGHVGDYAAAETDEKPVGASSASSAADRIFSMLESFFLAFAGRNHDERSRGTETA